MIRLISQDSLSSVALDEVELKANLSVAITNTAVTIKIEGGKLMAPSSGTMIVAHSTIIMVEEEGSISAVATRSPILELIPIRDSRKTKTHQRI